MSSAPIPAIQKLLHTPGLEIYAQHRRLLFLGQAKNTQRGACGDLEQVWEFTCKRAACTWDLLHLLAAALPAWSWWLRGLYVCVCVVSLEMGVNRQPQTSVQSGVTPTSPMVSDFSGSCSVNAGFPSQVAVGKTLTERI